MMNRGRDNVQRERERESIVCVQREREIVQRERELIERKRDSMHRERQCAECAERERLQ